MAHKSQTDENEAFQMKGVGEKGGAPSTDGRPFLWKMHRKPDKYGKGTNPPVMLKPAVCRNLEVRKVKGNA